MSPTDGQIDVPRGAPMGSALRVLQVCEDLGRRQPVGVRELSREMGVPRSSVQRALETLEAAGWAVRSAEGEWSLSSRPALVAAGAGSAGALRAVAGPVLTRLQLATDESVRLWARDGRRVAIVVSLESAQAVRYVGPPPGTTLPLHASAAGKAILAALPADELDAVLAGPLEPLAERTVVDPAELHRQVDAIRRTGWAVTRHEARDDVGGVAAAVLDPVGVPIGAVSVTLPMHRLTDEIVERYGALAAEEAGRLGATLAGGAPGASLAG